MKRNAKLNFAIILSTLLFFALTALMEASAWARAGGGGSSGSRAGRSFSAPSMPSRSAPSSPGFSAPGQGAPNQPASGFFGRNPFLQGLAGGVAGGLLGSMLFGGVGNAASKGGMGGGGMGLLDIVIIGVLLYLAYRFYKKWRARTATVGYQDSAGYAEMTGYSREETRHREIQYEPESYSSAGEVERGSQKLRQLGPGFDEEALQEAFQDIFFRIQAAWMNRTIEGIENVLTEEMTKFFSHEFDSMRQKGRINRLENIAVRRVEPTEGWQEKGKDYVTVFITANLLDYTADDKTGEILGGDNLNPVKFQEFWTISRDAGSTQWQLSAINQVDEPSRPPN